MPNVKSIMKTMLKKGIPAEIMDQIDFSELQENQSKDVIELIEQMDHLLTQEECLSIMEEQGCNKTGKAHELNRSFGRLHAGKSIEERILLLDDKTVHPNVPCRVNDDGTLSIFWEISHDGNYQCVCSQYARMKKENPNIGNITKTYCGCCGGHIRHHYQNILGTKLRLKEIVSSPINSKGEKRCEFLFDILSSR